MTKLLAWLKPRWKAVGAFVVAGIGAALDAHLLSGTWAAVGHIAVALLTAGAVHQLPYKPAPLGPEVAPPPGG